MEEEPEEGHPAEAAGEPLPRAGEERSNGPRRGAEDAGDVAGLEAVLPAQQRRGAVGVGEAIEGLPDAGDGLAALRLRGGVRLGEAGLEAEGVGDAAGGAAGVGGLVGEDGEEAGHDGAGRVEGVRTPQRREEGLLHGVLGGGAVAAQRDGDAEEVPGDPVEEGPEGGRVPALPEPVEERVGGRVPGGLPVSHGPILRAEGPSRCGEK